MARLKSSVSESQFRAALGIAFLHEAGTVRMKDPRVWLTAGRTGAGGRLQTGSMNDDSARFGGPLWLLLGVVGLVMLVACANLAGLMLARGTARRHEFAVRAALGAGCSQLVRQSLTETVLIALLSGGLGLVLALWGKTLIARLMLPTSEGLYYDTSLDLRVLSFTLGTSLLAALLSGLWPALRAARVDPSDGLKNRVNLGSLHLRTGRVLVSAQITLSLLLLGGAGLFVRTLINLTRIDTGYALDHLLTFTIDLRRSGYKGREPRTVAFFARVEESLAAIPGVDSVALVGWRLLANEGTGEIDFTILGDGSGLAEKNRADGRPFDYRQRDQWANFSFVSERFFETLGIPIVFGRDLRAADFAEAPQAVIVNEAFTRKYSPVRNPIGLTIIDRRNNANLLIVGVCRDAKYGDIQENIRPMVHQLVRQYPAPAGVFILRTSLPPVAVAAAARKAVMAADPNVPLIDFGTLQQVRDGTISRQRTFAVLCGSLAALTLLLSCIGLYGLMAYQVARRTCEIGIRQALGATRRQIAMPILREALALSGIGIAMGTPLTLALTRTIRASFYGVGPADPITFCGAAILFLAVSLIAAWIPALRAARVDPAVALRSG